MRTLRMLLAAAWLASAPAGAADADSGSGADISACVDLSGSLPHVGTVLPDKRMADIVAAQAASGLRMDPDTIDGLSLQSRFFGTAFCQRNTLTRTTAAGHVEITMPGGFSGGEGALCAGDSVRLASLRGRPALIDENPMEGRTRLDVSIRRSKDWTPTCALTIQTRPHYKVLERFCHDAICDMLERVAVALADAQAANPARPGNITVTSDLLDGHEVTRCTGGGCPPTWQQLARIVDARRMTVDALPSSRQLLWMHMVELAYRTHLDVTDLPTPGGSATGAFVHSYLDSSLLPIVATDEILIARVGTAGFGSHFGSALLFSAYRLRDDALEPVAGFYLDVGHRTLIASKIGGPP